MTRLLRIAGCVLVSACASPPHDTLGFKGVVYSRNSETSSGQTFAVPGAGFATVGGGTLHIYVLALDDGSKYAVRSYNGSFAVGTCLAVYMSAERSQSAGYLNVRETTIVPSTGCKASAGGE